MYTAIKDITIPSGVTTIEYGAFENTLGEDPNLPITFRVAAGAQFDWYGIVGNDYNYTIVYI